ncbi:hypothetical protein [Naasia lichenicola]|uniref:DUF1330 domain-containing protein n=1 Tax=Naasia lichenicola TaxID=2565933 RepID=A0A4S4FRG5_9MICO|nr:hypothetical protein [Naasia lichenicola]THG33233.1 hypothetical protein E6C64_02440 [Naasia lichenicola]
MSGAPTPIVLCCLLWAKPGERAGLRSYEDAVIQLLGDHGAEILERLVSNVAPGQPDEVQVYRFPSQEAFDSFLADPRRLERAAERDRVVARTELFPVRRLLE